MKITKKQLRSYLLKSLILEATNTQTASSLAPETIELFKTDSEGNLSIDCTVQGGVDIAILLNFALNQPSGMRELFGNIAEDLTSYKLLPNSQNLNNTLEEVADSPAADVVSNNWPGEIKQITNDVIEFNPNDDSGCNYSVKSSHIASSVSSQFSTTEASLIKLIGWQIKKSDKSKKMDR